MPFNEKHSFHVEFLDPLLSKGDTLQLCFLLSIVLLISYIYIKNTSKRRSVKESMVFQKRSENYQLHKKVYGQPIPQSEGFQNEGFGETKPKEMMPRETEEMLLEKLSNFESTRQFTEKGLSLSTLAGRVKTNTKYLSYVINKHKGKDFNSYINELRVGFILAKMDEDHQYLQYKISYLAEESGFSSHSKFSKVFKQITGDSPSVYMDSLKKLREEKKSKTTICS